MKLSELKQKIKDIGAEHGLKISAACGVICGVIGMVAAEYYRREYNALLVVDPNDDWAFVEIPKKAVDAMYNGAVLKTRMRTDGDSWYSQSTTEDEFVDDANGVLDIFPFPQGV